MSVSTKKLNKQLLSLSADSLIELYEIDFSSLQHDFEQLKDIFGTNVGADAVYRFCSAQNSTNPIVWQGKSYQPLPIKVEDFENSSSGKLPRPKLTIANPEGLLSKIVYSNQDFLGCTVTRKRTFLRFLDDENFELGNRGINNKGKNPFGKADSKAHLPDDIYKIYKKIAENKNIIQFELASPLEMDDVVLPARQILANHCPWTYRCEIGCGYSGLPIETSSGKDLTTGFSETPEIVEFNGQQIENYGAVIPQAYTTGVPHWYRYGYVLNASQQRELGTKDSPGAYKLGDVVQIVNKNSENVYLRTPQYFVCVKSHELPFNYHPFLNREHWAKDECSKSLEACKKRFSNDLEYDYLKDFNDSLTKGGNIKFGGFPGAEKYGIE